MRLIIGGSCNGKYDYLIQMGYAQEDIADSRVCNVEDIFAKPVIYKLHELVKRLMADKTEPVEYILSRLRDDLVIVCDEVGSGVVPIDLLQNEYRENVGMVCQKIAAQAQVVERVYCGIPVRIK